MEPETLSVLRPSGAGYLRVAPVATTAACEELEVKRHTVEASIIINMLVPCSLYSYSIMHVPQIMGPQKNVFLVFRHLQYMPALRSSGSMSRLE